MVVGIKRVGGVTLFLIVFVILFDQNRESATLTRIGAVRDFLLFLALGLFLRPTGVAATLGTMRHSNGLGLPVHLWVMFLEPSKAQYYALLTQLCNGEECTFCMTIVPQCHVRNFGNCSGLVCSSVDIEDWDRGT